MTKTPAEQESAYIAGRRESATLAASGGAPTGNLSNGIVFPTGSNTPRMLADLMARIDGGASISVKDATYGAKGDGTTDDTDAINAAFAALRAATTTSNGWTFGPTIVFPSGTYLVTDSINATGITAVNWGIEALGAVIIGACDGKPVLDMLGSRWMTIRGLTIVGDETAQPTYGIQTGLVNDTSCGESDFDVGLYGFFSKAAFYNFAGEVCRYPRLKIVNDSEVSGARCLILDSMNAMDITSEFITQTIAANTQKSFNEQTFFGADIRKRVTGCPIEIFGNVNRHVFLNSYAVSVDSDIVKIQKATAVTGLTLDIHVETTGALRHLMVDTTNPASSVFIQGLRLKDHESQAADSIIDVTGNTRQLILDAADIDIRTAAVGTMFGDGYGAPGGILASGDIRWGTTTTLSLANCHFSGRIFTEGSTTITAPAGGTYDVIRTPSSATNRRKETVGTLFVNGTLQFSMTRTTTTALEAVGNAINTTDKFAGKTVINTSTGAIVTAADATAGGVWQALDGTTAHTPV